MNKKRVKRIHFLRHMESMFIKFLLLPLGIVLLSNNSLISNNQFLISVMGWQNVQLLYISVIAGVVYLLVYPMYSFWRGLHLFNWDWVDLLDSLRATFKIRYALFRQPNKNDTDRNLRDFNWATKKATLSMVDDTIEFAVPMPRTIDAQKMMTELEPFIRDRLGLMFPEYSLSAFEHKDSMLVLTGSLY